MLRFDIPFKLEQMNTRKINEDGNNPTNSQYFAGSLLIAMPSLQDPCFKESVILLLGHDETMAVGVIINKPTGFMQFGRADDFGEAELDKNSQLPVYLGGPVDSELAMVLHSHCRWEYESTQVINEYFSVSSNIGILEDISQGEGPKYNIFSLGYSCWASGQLEQEIQANAWLVGNSSLDLVFKTSPSDRWSAAIRSLGFDPTQISMFGGTA